MYKKNNKIITTVFLTALLGSPMRASAVETSTVETSAAEPSSTTDLPSVENTSGFILYGALTFGGDALATASNDDGDDMDLDAGGLFHFGMGYEKRFGWGGIRATGGYKFDTLNAENGDADITRFPLEGIVYKTFAARHNLGGGLVYEMSPKFEMNIDDAGSIDVDFDDAAGFMIYYGFTMVNTLELGVRYTNIEYEADFLEAVDASNFGLYINFMPF
jgi:hypothetical protein